MLISRFLDALALKSLTVKYLVPYILYSSFCSGVQMFSEDFHLPYTVH